MKNRKTTFDELFDKIDWVLIESKRTWALSPDAIAIGFYPKDKRHPETINEVRIRIGANLLQKIKWRFGDRICVLHDPDDLMSFYLTKSESGSGFRLQQEPSGTIGRLNFKWDRAIALEQRDCKPVKFHIHKGGIVIFRVGNQEEQTE